MNNVINLADRRPRILPATNDLAEAFGMVALLMEDWHSTNEMVRTGRLVLVDVDLVTPLANPYPTKPIVRFAGQDKTASEIVALAAAHLPGRSFSPLMATIFAGLNRDDPDNPIKGYADAIELLDAIICDVQADQEETPAHLKRNGIVYAVPARSDENPTASGWIVYGQPEGAAEPELEGFYDNELLATVAAHALALRRGARFVGHEGGAT